MGFDVLITYGWVRSAYAAARSLARIGLRVAVADSYSHGMCHFSRFCRFVGKYSPPLSQPTTFIEEIRQLLLRTEAKFLLPVHDETEVIAKHRSRLPKDLILPIAPYEKVRIANDKARVAELAAELGAPIPEVIEWESISQLERRIQRIEYPVVIRLRRGNSAKGVFFPRTKKEVLTVCRQLIERFQLPPERYPVIQQRIRGEGWGVSCLYWQGKRIASFTHRRLREKIPTGGPSTLRESRRNTTIEEYAYRLLDALNWHGLAMVEFKWDPQAGRAWIIEINPRLWGSIHLAIASGVDFPALLYVAATEGPSAARRLVRTQRDGIIARWYLGDIIAGLVLLGHGRLGRAARAVLPAGCHTFDDIPLDDLGAFLGELVHYGARFLGTRSWNPVEEGMIG